MSLVRLMRRTALFAYNLTALQNLYLRLQTTLYKYSFICARYTWRNCFHIALFWNNYKNTFSVCGNKTIIQIIEKKKITLTKVKLFSILSIAFHATDEKKNFLSQKQDVEKLALAYFIRIFFK